MPLLAEASFIEITGLVAPLVTSVMGFFVGRRFERRRTVAEAIEKGCDGLIDVVDAAVQSATEYHGLLRAVSPDRIQFERVRSHLIYNTSGVRRGASHVHLLCRGRTPVADQGTEIVSLAIRLKRAATEDETPAGELRERLELVRSASDDLRGAIQTILRRCVR